MWVHRCWMGYLIGAFIIKSIRGLINKQLGKKSQVITYNSISAIKRESLGNKIPYRYSRYVQVCPKVNYNTKERKNIDKTKLYWVRY